MNNTQTIPDEVISKAADAIAAYDDFIGLSAHKHRKLALIALEAAGWAEMATREVNLRESASILRQMIEEKKERTNEAHAECERLRGALEKIERWFGEFPATSRYWDDGEEMSYSAVNGSNGERDYMRGIARQALGKEGA